MNGIQAALTPRLIDSLYTESMLLADEARAYFDSHGRDQRMALDPLLRVGFSCESLKVTTRLMHVIAWLLTQRALAAGEIDAVQAGRPERQLGEPIESDEAVLANLPHDAAALIRASEDLFDRVRRLEQGQAAEEPAPSPARSLLSRLQRAF
jgi:regulator of CtrA degradation